MAERIAYSLRALEQRYGVSRDRWARAVRAGELRAACVGLRRYTVLDADARDWLARFVVRATNHAESVVADRIAREEKRSA